MTSWARGLFFALLFPAVAGAMTESAATTSPPAVVIQAPPAPAEDIWERRFERFGLPTVLAGYLLLVDRKRADKANKDQLEAMGKLITCVEKLNESMAGAPCVLAAREKEKRS